MDDDIPDAHVQLDTHVDSDAYDYGHAHGHVDGHYCAYANRGAIEHLRRRMLIGLHPVPGCARCN